MTQGRIVEYIEEGKIVAALCLQDKGGRLHLITANNREVNLTSKRALLVSAVSFDVSRPREELLEALRAAEQKRNILKKEINTAELWELIKDEAMPLDNVYLAKLVFGESVSDEHVSSLVRVLFEDRLYFKLKESFFIPNTDERVELLKRQAEEEALREERLSRGALWLKKALHGNLQEDSTYMNFVLGCLKDIALYGRDAASYEHAKELLARAGVTDTREARRILVKLGTWDEDEHLELIKSDIPVSFSEDLLEEAGVIAIRRPETKSREDLRDLPVMTIDGPFTRDYDDALSLVQHGETLELWMHIADVAAAILPGTDLDKEAWHRASTLYLPRQIIPMLPPELSQEGLSLKAGLDRPALSLKVVLTRDGEVLNSQFLPSIIRVSRQTTYEEVNASLTKEAILSEMHRIVSILREKRLAAGAIELSLPELVVKFDHKGNLNLELIPQNSPSRFIVSELMILYNFMAARFCRDNAIPVLYRNQPPPNEIVSRGEADFIFYAFQQRRKLNPIQISLSAGAHSGLGVDAYIHATSPIRRYLDLVVQRQIIPFCEGCAPTYSEKDLDEIRTGIEPVVKEMERIKRNRLRYWVTKFLSQNKEMPLKAIVLDELKNKYRVILKDFLLISEMKRENGMLLKPGDAIGVKVKKADPWEEVLEIVYRGERQTASPYGYSQ